MLRSQTTPRRGRNRQPQRREVANITYPTYDIGLKVISLISGNVLLLLLIPFS